MKSNVIAIIGNEFGQYQRTIVNRAHESLRSKGYSVVYVSGGELVRHGSSDDIKPTIRNMIYPVASNYDVDGYIIIASTIGQFASDLHLKKFVKHYSHKPLACIGSPIADVTCVHPDDYGVMSSLMDHMTQDSSRQRFVYIRGFPDAPIARRREQAFRDGLERKGIPVDESLIIDGNYQACTSYYALDSLLKHTRDIDAVVACNDEMAHSAVHALANHGLRVPMDVIVSGFDDASFASTSVPPLTTVDYSIDDMVSIVVDQLLAQLDSYSETDNSKSVFTVPSVVRVRASSDLSLAASSRNSCKPEDEKFDAECFRQLLLDNLRTIRTPVGLSLEQVVGDLVSILVNADATSQSTLEIELARLQEHPEQIYWWRQLHNQICDTLRYQCVEGLSAAGLALVVNILGKIHMGIWQVEASLNVSDAVVREALQQFRTLILGVSTLDELTEVLDCLAENIPISGGYLCVYYHSGGYPDEFARVAYSAPNCENAFDPDVKFPSVEILPQKFLQTHTKGPLVVEPVCVGSTHLGYMVFNSAEGANIHNFDTKIMSDLIASALWRCLLTFD